MNDILYKIAKKYNRKGDSAGKLRNLVEDASNITNDNDLKLFLFNIPRYTKFSFSELAVELISDDRFENAFKILLEEFSTIKLDYNDLFIKAIERESYSAISLLLDNVYMQELYLSNNGYECLYKAMDKSFTIYDKVLGAVITQMSHTNSVSNLNILELFMVDCIINKEITKLASLCTGALFLTKDESAVKLLMNTAATIAFEYMGEDDIYKVVDDINSRMILSKYLQP